MSDVIETIKAQHRDFARVLKVLGAIIDGPIEERRDEDIATLFDIVHYTRVFPDKLHHPDEERCVFGPLRAAAPEHAAMLDTVRAEHDRADSLTARLHDTVSGFDRGEVGPEALRSAVRNYLAFQYEHMRKEEDEILPLVRKALDDNVYQAASKAFARHADPLFGENLAAGFAALSRRIAARAPG